MSDYPTRAVIPPKVHQVSVLPIYDAFLDLPHPCASPQVNERRIIIAPPAGAAFEASKEVGIELATNEGIDRISTFCFPEVQVSGAGANLRANTNTTNANADTSTVALNRHDVYLSDVFFSNRSTTYTSSSLGPSFHSFAMQLASGQRVYGHVRRYYPHHTSAKSRLDVGRRGIRAAVILTRHFGAESFYHSLLK